MPGPRRSSARSASVRGSRPGAPGRHRPPSARSARWGHPAWRPSGLRDVAEGQGAELTTSRAIRARATASGGAGVRWSAARTRSATSRHAASRPTMYVGQGQVAVGLGDQAVEPGGAADDDRLGEVLLGVGEQAQPVLGDAHLQEQGGEPRVSLRPSRSLSRHARAVGQGVVGRSQAFLVRRRATAADWSGSTPPGALAATRWAQCSARSGAPRTQAFHAIVGQHVGPLLDRRHRRPGPARRFRHRVPGTSSTGRGRRRPARPRRARRGHQPRERTCDVALREIESGLPEHRLPGPLGVDATGDPSPASDLSEQRVDRVARGGGVRVVVRTARRRPGSPAARSARASPGRRRRRALP